MLIGIPKWIRVFKKIKLAHVCLQQTNELVASSLDSSEENGRQEEKKRKIDHAKEAQLAHQKMCQKATDTMNNVNDLLAQVNTYLDKSKI